MPRTVEGADLFCGGGGTSMGLALACQDLGVPVRLIAINHWDVAIATHSKNHPWAEHLCAPVESLHPPTVVPSGRLNILIAAPECTHFSTARGGKPKLDQKRASPWHILPWLSQLYVDRVLIENVPEFQSWGPLGADGQPLKSKRGETFASFVHAIRSLGYTEAHRVLNAADYGDATSRRRLFILAWRGNRKRFDPWPRPTHSRGGKAAGTKPWRAAREIIDWQIEGESIFTRKRPLAPATMRRILAGLEKFGGKSLKPFLVVLQGTSDASSVEDPVPGITAGGNHVGLAESFLLGQNGNAVLRPVGEPVPTIAAAGAIAKVDAFVVNTSRPETNRSLPRSVEEPLPTIVAHRENIALIEPFVLSAGGPEVGPRSVDEPLNTVLTRDHMALAEPFILPPLGYHHRDGKANVPRSVEDPLQTITRRGGGHLVSAHLQSHFGERDGQRPRIHSVEDPVPTITQRGPALVEGVLIDYHGQSSAHSVDAPMPTFGTKQQLGLVQPELNGYRLDIRFRMLQPHELAAAMGFGSEYAFTGRREEVVRQIGNAVAVNMARALCRSLLEE